MNPNKNSHTAVPSSTIFLAEENKRLSAENAKYAAYIRQKVNELLSVMGTSPLRHEELDDMTLLDLDPIGIIAGSFRQVLEHLHRANQELRLAKDELNAIFNATGVGISIIDRGFRILRCNERQRSLLADKDNVLAGRHCYEVFCRQACPPDECPALETFISGKSVLLREFRMNNKFFQIVSTPYRNADGDVSGAIEVILDVTERREALETARTQRGFYLTEKSKLATVIENLSDGLIVTDQSGRAVSANAAACAITGLTESEIIGLKCHALFQLLGNIERPTSLCSSNIRETVITIRHRSSGERYLSFSSSCLNDADGQYIGNVFTFRDITEERRRDEWERRIEKLAALGQLSAGVAHELNTPLGCILGYTRLLLKDPSITTEQNNILSIVAEQAKRGSSIIRELLSFTRHASNLPQQRKRCDVNVLVRNALSMLEKELQSERIATVLKLGETCPIMANPDKIEQVLINIMRNAFQAMGHSGILTVETRNEQNMVQIRILDTGPGVPEEIRSRIFDPFFTTKAVGEGTGLGLAICSGIIDDHGGTIELSPFTKRGSCFTVSLPATDVRKDLTG